MLSQGASLRIDGLEVGWRDVFGIVDGLDGVSFEASGEIGMSA